MTQGNCTISERCFREGPVLVVYQKPEALKLTLCMGPYKGEGRIQRDWKMSGIGVHGVKFTKNLLKITLINIF